MYHELYAWDKLQQDFQRELEDQRGICSMLSMGHSIIFILSLYLAIINLKSEALRDLI